ncbi:MAG: site-2 protease family protein, partial [Patescibacteria group bacterium]
FGWAKPVPYNPYNLKNQKFGPALVAAAGPLSNFLIALLFGLFVRFAAPANLFSAELFSIIGFIISINLILMIFNLIPIPPLDGSKILFAFFPYKWQRTAFLLERYGLIIVLLFIFSFSFVFLKIASLLFSLLTGL